MQNYNQTNFFKYTFCEFQQVDNFEFPDNTNYKSKSESLYYYTKEGVYRKSNHWGRVANCRWKLISNENYKNQNTVIGFARWIDFYPINSSEKIFYIQVDFNLQQVKIQSEKENSQQHLFTFSEAQKRIKKINSLLIDDKWTTYYDEEIDIIKKKIISKYIKTNNSLQEIKMSFK